MWLKKENTGDPTQNDPDLIDIMLLAACLIISILLILLFVLTMADIYQSWNNIDSENENVPGGSVLAIFALGAAELVCGFFFSGAINLSSFLGFLLGRPALKSQITKKKTVWAKIITYSNLAVAIISAIPLVYYLWIIISLFI